MTGRDSYDPNTCPMCLEYYFSDRNRFLVEAAASVGISRNRSTQQVLWGFLKAYHDNKHKEVER